jgi:hypothetical protein
MCRSGYQPVSTIARKLIKLSDLWGLQQFPTVPMYGGDEEFSFQQRQQIYLPRQAGWPPAAPCGLRPIGGNVFGGFGAQPLGYRIGGGVGGYSDILAAQRLRSSFVSGLNGGGFAQR